jgi:thiol-disulfide isomerase/thioredoxin
VKTKLALLLLALLTTRPAPAQTQPARPAVPDEMMTKTFRPLGKSDPVRLVDHKGKTVVLALWTDWCVPCRKTLAELKTFRREMDLSKFEVVGLALEEYSDDAAAGRVVRDEGINFPLGWIDTKTALALTGDGPESFPVPQIFVVADGRVVKKFGGYPASNFPAKLREAVKQAAPAANSN